ncbi:MFS transporter [Ruegeria sp. 2012CJ41-6]|uniref:MFS transporter n=1 Tax=Ruegeria spongiae TaxID=2942209 RepID=A0ABT0PYJ8_9RHOB|nr:MFS transporter [Ruegeria spongiae]MCL6282622.1 MFS transporter [Ruegeria spongiae]
MPRENALAGGSALVALFLADLIVRTSYQIGKAPVLPVFAHGLGASPLLLGAIISVSTATGLFLKPLFGLLSDYRGRWIWLLTGTTLFTVIPCLYLFVERPSDLFVLRLIHGLSTAIYGPVTLAYIAAWRSEKAAEAFGWFGLARTTSYILGPLIGGVALTFAAPEMIYAATCFLSALAFIPTLYLKNADHVAVPQKWSLTGAVRAIASNRPLFILAVVEGTTYVAIYAVKAFMPVMALVAGHQPIEIGTFLAIQEVANAVLRPPMGRLADRTRPVVPLLLGLGALATGLLVLSAMGPTWVAMLTAALFIGAGQGAFGPATLSLVAGATSAQHLGLAFGSIGAIRNAGKIAGPIVAGALVSTMSYQASFASIAAIPLLIALWILCLSGTSLAIPANEAMRVERAKAPRRGR